jgi:hypothetical protein
MKTTQWFIIVIFMTLSGQILTQSYCDYEDYFVVQTSTSTIFSEPIPYCIDCPDEEGNLVTCNILLHRPIDALNQTIPLRPHIMYVHGFAPNSDLHDPLSVFAAASMRDEFTYYGYSASALQYRQDIKGFQAEVCDIPPIEVIRTHYRAIQDVRNAVDLLFRNAETYGIDTANFFLYGNSQGGMAVLHAAFVNNENEWLSGQFAEYIGLEQELGPWAPKHNIKGVISFAAGIYNVDFLDETDDAALFLGHGVCDEVVPIAAGTYFNCPVDIMIFGSLEIACRAVELNRPYSLHLINGIGHAWPDDVVNESVIQVRDWIKNQVLCGEPDEERFVYYEDELQCDTINIEDEFCISTSIVVLIDESAISIFPNPVHNYLAIRVPLNSKGHSYQMEMINSIGSTVLISQFKIGEKIDVSNLNSGLFYVVIYANGERIGVKKVIVL